MDIFGAICSYFELFGAIWTFSCFPSFPTFSTFATFLSLPFFSYFSYFSSFSNFPTFLTFPTFSNFPTFDTFPYFPTFPICPNFPPLYLNFYFSYIFSLVCSRDFRKHITLRGQRYKIIPLIQPPRSLYWAPLYRNIGGVWGWGVGLLFKKN